MRIIATADLHGSLPHYQALAALIRMEQPQALLLAGDLLQIVAQPDAIPLQRRFVLASLRPWLEHVRALAPNCTIYAVPGNWDYRAHDADFAGFGDTKLWVWLDRRAVPFTTGWWIAGLGDVPITLAPPKDRDRPDIWGAAGALPEHAVVSDGDRLRPATYEEIMRRAPLADKLGHLARLSPPQHTLYVLHAPPADTALDVTERGTHVGSQAVRQFIDTYQPPITVHGHIHESPHMSGTPIDHAGRTVAINAGQRRDALCAVVFDLDAPARSLQHRVIPC